MKTIKAAEIFACGSWNGSAFTEKDLDAIVNSFVALSLEGRVPLKLGHDGPDARDDPQSQFAMGWVRRVWREDSLLKADLEVPDKVASAIDEGYLRFVSVELLPNVKADTRVLPWVLDGVALLGASQPAVGIMKDLRAVMTRFTRSKFSVECTERRTFKRDQSNGDSQQMTDAEIIAQQKVELAAAIKATADLKLQFERDTQDRIKRSAENVLKKAKAMFKKAIDDGQILPATETKFFRFSAPREDDHARWAEFDVAEVEEAIAANPKPGAKKFGKTQGASGDGSGNDFEESIQDLDESQKMSARVDKFCRENKVDVNDIAAYDRAIRTVLSQSKEQGGAYVHFVRTGDSPAAAA